MLAAGRIARHEPEPIQVWLSNLPADPHRPEVGLDPPADDVAAWFTGRELRPEGVAPTESALTPSARTRFSPVDVTVISPAAPDEWADVVRALGCDSSSA
ncbi:hypothetical protein OG800_01520 [Streptomyces sp. NBC_00445]|uniref:hypothetical protein n=1 Tax=Streptomyces sp. NBC_00445 TaxID=2975745 RepID=UPI002E251CCD